MNSQIGAPFSALDFDVLCQLNDRDRLPFPLEFTSDAQWSDEVDLERRAAARRLLDRNGDHRLTIAIHTLLNPVVRVEVCGVELVDAQGRSAESMIRIHAGIDHQYAALARQSPGSSVRRGGDVVLSLSAPTTVGEQIATALPPALPGAGDVATVHKTDLAPRDQYAQPTSWLVKPVSAPRQDPVQLAKALFAQPADRVVEITLDLGPAYDGRKANSGVLVKVVDVRGRGRYLITDNDTSYTVTPGTPLAIATDLNRRIETRLDQDRRQATW